MQKAGREGLQSGKQNGIGWSRKSCEIVTFKLNPKEQKGANRADLGKSVPITATVSTKARRWEQDCFVGEAVL